MLQINQWIIEEIKNEIKYNLKQTKIEMKCTRTYRMQQK